MSPHVWFEKIYIIPFLWPNVSLRININTNGSIVADGPPITWWCLTAGKRSRRQADEAAAKELRRFFFFYVNTRRLFSLGYAYHCKNRSYSFQILLERRVVSPDSYTTKWTAPPKKAAQVIIDYHIVSYITGMSNCKKRLFWVTWSLIFQRQMERRVKESVIAPVPRLPASAQLSIAGGPPRLALAQVLICIRKHVHSYF